MPRRKPEPAAPLATGLLFEFCSEAKRFDLPRRTLTAKEQRWVREMVTRAGRGSTRFQTEVEIGMTELVVAAIEASFMVKRAGLWFAQVNPPQAVRPRGKHTVTYSVFCGDYKAFQTDMVMARLAHEDD